MPSKLLSFHQFKSLPSYVQITHLNESAIAMDVYFTTGKKDFVLFAYNGFYIELIVEALTDEIQQVRCFKNTRNLDPYLEQIDISEIALLLQCR